MNQRRRQLLAMLAALALCPASLATADRDSKRGGESKHDHEEAAEARRAGDIRPLSEILEVVRSTYPGEVVGVEIEREHGAWIYEIKLVSADSRYLEIYVDARTKEIIKVGGK